MSEKNITRLDAFTYRQILSEDDPVVLIPVGAIEQHGPHMPLSVDVLLSTTMAELTADRLGAALVGPTVTTGYKSQQRSGGGNHIVGSFGFDAETVIGVCRTLVRELARHGARRIVFVNGHYENYQFLYEGVDLALRELAPSGEVPQVMLLSYWDFVTEEVIARLYPEGFPGWDVEHGGVMETSLMLEFFPELVHMDRVMDLPAADLPLYDLLPVDPSLTPESGCLSSAQAASAEKGQVLAASVVEGMTEAITSRFTV
ncbi:creatininase [Actinomyces howellii]|uniref:Creatinine amidohydrolase n=1 Tax=Actinomyces howellii TaxID=52771 RepID=A0A3S4SLH9_9ACTO|nr:creatininase [Actinomyces howellii]VEG26059.1 Creatinine amidohydrolase [Actinomyces howellii]